MNKNYLNDATYGQSLEALAFSECAKSRMKNALLSADSARHNHFHRPASVVAIAAALSVFLVVSAAAAFLVIPTLKEYYQNSQGYQQSSVEINQSVAKNGWTMTLTDCVMDEYNIYVGVNLSAPDGTVLNNERGYKFDEWSIYFDGEENIGGASRYELIRGENDGDNSLSFILWSRYPMRDIGMESLDGRKLDISLGGLYHNGEWDEDAEKYDKLYDCQETWNFTTRIKLPEKTISIEPNTHIVTLNVDACITKLEITPIGAYIYIESDELKGHHSWVPMNAPDGWYGCVEYQDVVLHLVDGSEIALTEGMDGSGCSGGTDVTEPGRLFLARRGETLLDIETVDYITVCGVDISLK